MVGPGGGVGDQHVGVGQIEGAEGERVEGKQCAVVAFGAWQTTERGLAEVAADQGRRQFRRVDHRGDDRRIGVEAGERIEHPFGTAELREVVVDEGDAQGNLLPPPSIATGRREPGEGWR